MGGFALPGPGPMPGASSAAGLSDTILRTAYSPTATFATPGDVSVSYTTQQGAYAKVGPLVLFWVNLTFTPTYTTALGSLVLSLPPPPITDLQWAWSVRQISNVSWPAGTTDLVARPFGTGVNIYAQGSAATAAALGVTQFTSGGTYLVAFSGYYF